MALELQHQPDIELVTFRQLLK